MMTSSVVTVNIETVQSNRLASAQKRAKRHLTWCIIHSILVILLFIAVIGFAGDYAGPFWHVIVAEAVSMGLLCLTGHCMEKHHAQYHRICQKYGFDPVI